MHPEKLGISACDLESLRQSQSTQTSGVSIDRISKPPSKNSRPPGRKDKSDKSSITVFEFCQFIQNPESPQDITLIKETVTEETKPHPSKGQDSKSSTSSEESTANRYKYCKEIIKPYLKHSDCPESEEELLKNAIDSVTEDFPDYQPCFEVFDSNKKDIADKITGNSGQSSRRSSISTVDAGTSTSHTSSMEINKESEKCIPTAKSTERVTESKISLPVEHCKDPGPRDCSPPPKCTKKKSAEGKERKCCPKQPSPIVLCDSCEKEPAIGVKCQKPTYYLTERCKNNDSITNMPEPSPPHESDASFIENHKKTISTLKVAVEDFAGKVYKTTRDAVTLISTESAKQIDKMKQMTAAASNTNEPKRCGNQDSENQSSFNFFRKVDNSAKQDKSNKPELPKISEMVGVILSKVDSTLTTLSDTLSFDNLPDALKPKNYNDVSSPYDIPAPPKDVANILISPPPPPPQTNAPQAPVPTSNSMFATIKDKIVSMFREEEPKPKESASRSSTMTNSSSSSDIPKNTESDENLVDKVIE